MQQTSSFPELRIDLKVNGLSHIITPIVSKMTISFPSFFVQYSSMSTSAKPVLGIPLPLFGMFLDCDMPFIVRGIREDGLKAIERALELDGVNPVRSRCHPPGPDVQVCHILGDSIFPFCQHGRNIQCPRRFL